MNITQVEVKQANDGGSPRLKGYASITIDNCFVIHNIKIIKGNKGLFIAMPSRIDKDGSFKDICHPINSKTRDDLHNAILEKYNELLEEKE